MATYQQQALACPATREALATRADPALPPQPSDASPLPAWGVPPLPAIPGAASAPGQPSAVAGCGVPAARSGFAPLLDPRAEAEFKRALFLEWQPESLTEQVLVDQLAAHAAGLRRANELEAAALRASYTLGQQYQEFLAGDGAALLGSLALPPTCGDAAGSKEDDALLFAVNSPAVARAEQYRRGHERGFARTLEQLTALRAPMDRGSNRTRTATATPCDAPQLQSPLPDEVARLLEHWSGETRCEAYLLARLRGGLCPCHHCGGMRGYWLARRARFECAGCGRQRSPREGTVMQGSHLGYAFWFRAITLVVFDPLVGVRHVREITGVRRETTLRHALRRIRDALRAPDAQSMLMGLDRPWDALAASQAATMADDHWHLARTSVGASSSAAELPASSSAAAVPAPARTPLHQAEVPAGTFSSGSLCGTPRLGEHVSHRVSQNGDSGAGSCDHRAPADAMPLPA
ncbi:MAG: transposase [Planctomycetota bacterium]